LRYYLGAKLNLAYIFICWYILKFGKFKMTASFGFVILLTSPNDINLIAQIYFLLDF